MTDRLKGTMVAATVAGALAAGGVAAATAASGDDADGGSDRSAPVQGDALVRATQAALRHAGGGRVTDTEVGDEEGYYEVEIRRADGSQFDVHLDRGFNVIDQSRDEDGSGREDASQGD